MLTWVVGVVSAAGAWTLAGLALDAYGRRPLPSGQWDAAVVLGAAVRTDGQPSPALARRVQAAVALWRQGRVERVMLTGGVGHHPPAEADAAAALCLSLGVPAASLVVERCSTDTRGNASWSRAALGDCSVVVVTDSYHCLRCYRLFMLHFRAVETLGTVPPWRARVKMTTRELVSLVWHGVQGHL